MNINLTSIEVLKKKAKKGDVNALEELRARNFFEDKKKGAPGWAASKAQYRLWIIEQLSDSDSGYSIPKIFGIQGNFNTKIYIKAFNMLIKRHESLRSRFEEFEGKPRQIIEQEINFEPEIIDLQSEESAESKAKESVLKDISLPFDLKKGPLIRAKIFCIEKDKYCLYINIHHIVFDGRSLDIMFTELMNIYNALLENKEPDLKPIEIQYKDYAAWHNALINRGVMIQHRQYWHNKMGKDLPTIDLPTDFKRPMIRTSKGGKFSFTFDKYFVESMDRVCSSYKVNRFMLLNSVLKILLHKYSRQEDIITGTTISGRDHPDLENTIGFFVNIIALRDTLGPNDSFSKVLSSVSKTTLQAYDHQIYPFDMLVSELDVDRDTSRSPIFDVFISYQYVDYVDAHFNDSKISNFDINFVSAKFDLTFLFTQADGELVMEIVYAASLFEDRTIQFMAGHFNQTALQCLDNPDILLKDIDILTPVEKQKILIEWNNTLRPYQKDLRVHQLFEMHAKKQPDSIAAFFEDSEITYKELNEKANKMANYLHISGVSREILVGICVKRSFDILAAILGVLKAGGAYLPIDPSFPKDRIEYMLSDSNAKFFIAEQDILGKLSEQTLKNINIIDPKDKSIAEYDSNDLENVNGPDDLIYVIYTSGTTGNPKGVMIRHESVSARMAFLADFYGLSDKDISVHYRSFSFDAAIEEYLLPFLIGGKTVIAPSSISVQDDIGIYLLNLIDKHQITKINAPPALLDVILMHLEQDGTDKIKSLRVAVSGGDQLGWNIISRFYALFKDATLYNAYGPTENTNDSAIWPTRLLSEEANVPIGKPVANSTAYILDSNLKPVPVKIPGELHVGGVGLARGYLGRAELTKEKFIKNPFVSENNEKIYKTGDLCRWLPDGSIEFIGRADNQVKIRGFRIELGEIEADLLKLDTVKDCVVKVCKTDTGDKRLAAYIVSKSAGQKDGISKNDITAQMREELRKRLPPYMIPSFFIFIDALPLNSNGKIDRNALPDPAAEDKDKVYIKPKTETEKHLLKIWQDVLNIENISTDDNFFDMGGHSLNATVILSKIHKQLNVKLSLKEIFNSPSIIALAKIISDAQPELFSKIVPVGQAQYYAVSNAQRRLWLLYKMGTDQSAYNMTGVYILSGDLNINAMQQAFGAIVERHESLRTSFAEIDETPRQIIHSPNDFKIEYYDLDAREDLKTKAREIAEREVHTPFDLEKGTLFIVKIYRVSKTVNVMLISMHHIVSDGWSMEILIKELSLLYSAFSSGKTNPLEPLKIQYKDYAAWQNKMLEEKESSKYRDFWHKKLSGPIEPLNLPTDRPRPAVRSFKGEKFRFSIDENVKEFFNIIRKNRSTSFMAAAALVLTLLHRYTGQKDIIIGSPVSGRDHPDLESQIGFYVNMIALRNNIESDQTFSEVLQTVNKNVTQGFDFQSYPFDRLLEELDIKRDMGRSPLFDVLVSMQNIVEEKSPFSGVNLEAAPFERKHSRYDLTFFFTERTDRLDAVIEYSTELFELDRIKRMADHLKELIKSVVKAPDIPIKKLNILPDQELKKLIFDFNDTKNGYPKDKTVAELFEQCVKNSPNSPAVVFECETVTYFDLNSRANRLAHYLRKKGVSKESIVSILKDRSIESIICILAILKAGGAYLPIDIGNPKERILSVIKASGTKILITDKKTFEKADLGKDLSQIDVIFLDKESNPAKDQPDSNIEKINSSDNLVYVMYTSGSTGVPKGVLVENKSVARLVLNPNYVTIDKDERVLLASSLAFDASTFEIWAALLNGGCLYPASKNTVLDFEVFKRFIKESMITTMWLTSSLFNQLAEADVSIFEPIKNLLIGGERLSVYHVNKAKEAFPKLKIINGYGPTENTTFTCCFNIDRTFDKDIPIGGPISNTKVYIIDENDVLSPIGIPGEICAAGDGLSRGYLNDNKLTLEKFVKNPFEEGTLIYRTGDLGAWNSDGIIEFKGRKDQQVKIRGYRTEPAEIEKYLLRHPQIKEAAAVPVKTSVGTLEIAAYYCAASKDIKEDQLDIRSFLSKTLPDYMIPAYFIKVDQIPLNENGKIDIIALPKPNTSNLKSDSYKEPTSQKEKLLVKIWQKVLGREKIGINDNFFSSGGDSIKAIQIAGRIKNAGFYISVPDIFENPTISRLVHLMSEKYREADQSEVTGSVPLSPIQRWFFKEHGHQSHFNQAVILKPETTINSEALKAALKKLQDHHDTLRMIYPVAYKKETSQVNAGTDLPVSLDIVYIDSIEDITKQAALVQQSIDLENGPLMKTILYKLKIDKNTKKEKDDLERLLIVIHHLVVDGVSWRILLEDLESFYMQAAAGKEITPPLKTLSFKERVKDIYDFASNKKLLEQIPYWLQTQSATVHTPLEPFDPSIKNVYGNRENVFTSLSVEDTEKLFTKANIAYNTEINDLLLTALARALKNISSRESILITLEGHGREPLEKSAELDRTVGWFTTMFPFILKAAGDDIGSQIKYIKESLRKIPGKGIGYGILKYITSTQDKKDAEFDVKPTVSFNYLGQFGGDSKESLFKAADENIGDTIGKDVVREHDFDFGGAAAGKKLRLHLTFTTAKHKKDKAIQMLESFKNELISIIDHCTAQKDSEKTASDFTHTDLEQEDLADILKKFES